MERDASGINIMCFMVVTVKLDHLSYITATVVANCCQSLRIDGRG